ncbi:MAG TPA: cytochrome c oxidase assembly protein, partial [Acidimicrobiales bacterium]|nr:cytochrome c oxidase assembly protein [Acidimicrobiales bacterium]
MLLVGVALGVAYVVSLHRFSRAWSSSRTVSFLSGCVVITATGVVGGSSFTAHMIEHVALGMVAPVLLTLGAPVTLALQAAPRRAASVLRRALHSRVASILTHPVLVWTLFGTTLVALVFSPLLEWSVRHDAIHAIVHVHFLTVGLLFAATMLAVDPIPRPLPY